MRTMRDIESVQSIKGRSRSERFLAHTLEELPEYIELLLEISRDIAAYDSLIAELKARGLSDEDISEILEGCL